MLCVLRCFLPFLLFFHFGIGKQQAQQQQQKILDTD